MDKDRDAMIEAAEQWYRDGKETGGICTTMASFALAQTTDLRTENEVLREALTRIRDSFLTRSESIPIHMMQVATIAENALAATETQDNSKQTGG